MRAPLHSTAATTPDAEWLTTNSGGSFAIGTIDRCPRRKYHGLLTVREPGVGEPINMVAEVEEWFKSATKKIALHSYNWGNTVEPNGVDYLTRFEPLPRWTYEFSGLTVTRELWLEDDADAVWIRYSIEGLTKPVDLRLRPLIRCRPIHKLTFANPFMNGELDIEDRESLRVVMHPYKNVPALITSLHGAAGTFRRGRPLVRGRSLRVGAGARLRRRGRPLHAGRVSPHPRTRRRVLHPARHDARGQPRPAGAQLGPQLTPILRQGARRCSRCLLGRARGRSHGCHRRVSLVRRMGAGCA